MPAGIALILLEVLPVANELRPLARTRAVGDGPDLALLSRRRKAGDTITDDAAAAERQRLAALDLQHV